MSSHEPIKDLALLTPAWCEFQTRASVEFRTLETEHPYQTMINLLDKLVDEINERGSHPLKGLLDIVSFFVRDYEERNIELPTPEPHTVLRFFMNQHDLG